MDTRHVFIKNMLRSCVSLLSTLAFEKYTHRSGSTNYFDELQPAAECKVPLTSIVVCYDVVAVKLVSVCDPCIQKVMKAYLRMLLVMFDAMSDTDEDGVSWSNTDEDGDAGSVQDSMASFKGMFDMMCAKDNEVT